MRLRVSHLRSLLRHLLVYLLYLTGSLARAKKRIQSQAGTVVLTFHRVLPDKLRWNMLSSPGMVLSQRTFARLVRYLSEEHQIVPLAGRYSRANPEWRIPVAITFDDGWSDNAEFAYPILSQHAAQATIFICPEKMGRLLPFWPEKIASSFRAAAGAQQKKRLLDIVAEYSVLPKSASLPFVIEIIKQLPPNQRDRLLERLRPWSSGFESSKVSEFTMSWETARRLSSAGVVFGSHTLRHEILTRIPVREACEEITSSRERIHRELGLPCFAFAYPNGNWSLEIRDLVASAGYTVAFINSPGIWLAHTDRFAIPRINLWEGAVTGICGRFSKAHFDYVVFWKNLQH